MFASSAATQFYFNNTLNTSIIQRMIFEKNQLKLRFQSLTNCYILNSVLVFWQTYKIQSLYNLKRNKLKLHATFKQPKLVHVISHLIIYVK